MFFSRYEIDIPAVDLLTYVFVKDPSISSSDAFAYASAENPKQKISKSELQSLVQRLASGLRKVAGVKDGDVVLQFAENSIWYPLIMLASIGAGGTFTGANPGYTETELVHQLKVSGAKCIFTDRSKTQMVLRAAQVVGIQRQCIFFVDNEARSAGDDTQALGNLLCHGMYQWDRITDIEALLKRPAVLNFSSGTTGSPKACIITHRNIVANAEQTVYLDQVSRSRRSDPTFATKDVHCAYVPLYHAMGLLTFCVVNLRRGCSTVIMRKFDLKLLLSSIQRFHITYLLLVPPVVVTLLKTPLLAQYDISSVKFLLCGAAPLSPEASAQVEKLFSANQARTRQGWGMTEATMAVTMFAPDEFDPTHRSVGYLVPNVQMKIVNEDGREVGYNEEGEALVRGPNVFQGYYKNAAATQDAWTVDGWLKTGDIVTIQPSGLVCIVDRKKELIKVNGFQVAPSELEGHLLEHEGVQDCAVIRVERNGYECPQAHVVRRGDVTAESILGFMKKRLSAHKRISGGIVFTEAIPKSPSGKILRRMLTDPHKERTARL